MRIDSLEKTKNQTAAFKDRLMLQLMALPHRIRMLIGLLLVGLVLSVAIAGAVQLFKAKEADNELAKAALTVAVQPVVLRPMERMLEVTGTVWAWDPLSIGAEVGGLRIDTVKVEEGDTVKKGQVLATLNSSILKAQLERELARLSHSRANLGKAIQPNRRQDIQSLKFAVEQAKALVAEEDAYLERAKANLENARNNSIRYQSLCKEGAVSKEEAEAKLTNLRTSEAELLHAQNGVSAAHFASRQAMERLSQALEGGRREDIDMSKADLSETQANVKALQAQIEQTIIRAPSDGLITKRDAHIGDISVATKPLFSMVRDNRLEVRAQVPERDLAKLKPEQAVEITGALNDGETIHAKVREISPLVDVDTRLGMVRIDIPFSKALHPGIFVHGKVKLGMEDVLTVPASAVVDRHEHSCIFLVEGNRVISRSVTCGERFGDFVEIHCGVKPGEQVVVSGAGFLKDGDIVRVSKAQPGISGEAIR